MAEVRRTVYYRITDLGRDTLAGWLEGDSLRSQVSKARPGAPSYSLAVSHPSDKNKDVASMAHPTSAGQENRKARIPILGLLGI